MKLFIAGIIVLAMSIVLLVNSCGEAEASDNSDRFITIYSQDSHNRGYTKIIRDTRTGHDYLVIYGWEGVGVCPLLDAND